MNHSFKQQLLWRFGILTGCLAAFIVAFYLLSQALGSQSAAITQSRTLLARYSTIAETLAQLKTEQPQAALYTATLRSALPSNEELLKFPDWMRAVATTRNLTLSFQFVGDSTAAQGNTPGSIRFRFSTSGGIDDTKRFVDEIERQLPQYLIALDKFELNRSGETYQLAADGKVFFK